METRQSADFDVICTGLAVADIFLSPVPEDIMQVQAKRVKSIGCGAGGDAVNQAVMLKKLGRSSALFARLGNDDIGGIVMRALKKEGVDTSLTLLSESSVTSAAVVLIKENGERSILSVKGNNADFCREDIEKNMPLPKARALSIASFFGLPRAEEDGGLLELLKQAKNDGVITFADMANDKLGLKLGGIKRFLPYIDYFAPSLGDAVSLSDGMTSLYDMAKLLCGEGAKNTVIKLGGKGAFAFDGRHGETLPAFKVAAADTTGAGDTFCAGLIHSVLKGKNIFDASLFACAAAAFSVQYYGASSAPLCEKEAENIMRGQK